MTRKKPRSQLLELRRVRILVVEDDVSFARLVRLLLEGEGFEVETAGTVQAAAVEALASSFDLIVSDLNLPDGDGEELLAFIAAERVRAIALTGYASAEDRHHSLERGFAAHLVKPVDPERLLRTVQPVLADTKRNPRRPDSTCAFRQK
jgi:CheY-like chemotaxis protein